MAFDEILARIDGTRLERDFHALCDFGGRLSGTPGERAAVDFLKRRLVEIPGGAVSSFVVPYTGWQASGATLDIGDEPHDVQPLVGSPATPVDGLTAEITDLGRGTQADFSDASDRIAGRIVRVRHEYMFDPEHVHRIWKYRTAVERGAVGFIVANPWTDSGRVAGGLGFGDPAPIPAVGVSAELAARIAQTPAPVAIRISVASESSEQTAESLVLDLPGRSDDWVVVSAHIDGHSVAESAIDNASGVVVAVAVAEALAPSIGALERGLRVCLFNIEEWGLLASRVYVEGLSQDARAAIALNVNLDSVAGADSIAVMISGFAGLAELVAAASATADVAADVHLPLVRNSDHYNFADAGIPAVRVVAGFGDPEASLRHVLTEGDTRALISAGELARSARLATAMTLLAAQADKDDVANWRASTGTG